MASGEYCALQVSYPTDEASGEAFSNGRKEGVQKWLSSTTGCKARHPPYALDPRDPHHSLLWLKISEPTHDWKPRGAEGERRSAVATRGAKRRRLGQRDGGLSGVSAIRFEQDLIEH
jgi:hypothetical protein